jgi:hypothetical protein
MVPRAYEAPVLRYDEQMIPAGRFLADHASFPQAEARAEAFERLGRLTALRKAGDDFYTSNPARGQLLYALIQEHKPRHVLEFGTGRGYGALSMAMAASDAGLDTEIHTVDVIPPSAKQWWAIDEGEGPFVSQRSIQEVWRQLPEEWTGRIRFLTGPSTRCMRAWLSSPLSPRIDFAFVDGGHDYWTARHDVLASVISGRGHSVSLLLDDYGGVQGNAVKEFVDRVLAPACPPDSVLRLAMPQTEIEARDNGEHGMVYVDARKGAVTPELLCGSLDPHLVASGHRAAVALSGAVLRARGLAGRALAGIGVRRAAAV